LAIEQTSGRERLNTYGAIVLETGQTRMINATSTIRRPQLGGEQMAITEDVERDLTRISHHPLSVAVASASGPDDLSTDILRLAA
jgi:hypothetical protein